MGKLPPTLFVAALACLAGLTADPASAKRQYVIAADVSSDPANAQEAAYLKRMGELLRTRGFVVGSNLRIEAMAKGSTESDAASMLALKPDLVHVRNTRMAKEISRLSPGTPVVFRVGSDPLASGLIESYARPGMNMTGVVALGEAMLEKRIELVRELLPKARRVAIIANLRYQRAADLKHEEFLQSRARKLGLTLSFVDVERFGSDCARVRPEIEAARPDAMMIEPPFDACTTEYFALEAELRIPAISGWFEGVAQLAADEEDNLRMAMDAAARVLKGERPATIPVARTQRFILTVDLKRARALGIEVPTSLLLRADRVLQ